MTLTNTLRGALSLLVTAALYTQTLSAQNAQPEKRIIKQVQIISVGGAEIDKSRILANMGTREGGVLREEDIDRDIKNLYASGLVETVDISTADAKGGVTVIVKVTGRGAIGEVSFVGNVQVDSEKLRKGVEVKINEPVDEAKLYAGANKIRDIYSKKGFADIGVVYKTESLPTKGFVRVIYTISEGQRGIINDISFEGLTAIKARDLRSKMTLKIKRPWYLWGKAGKLNNDALQEDIHTIERAIQDKGYVYAKVAQVRREPVKSDSVNLVFVINEGKQYNVSGVSLEGNTVFTKDELAPALILEVGIPYSATDISKDEKQIGDYYGSRGYADARIDTSVIPDGKESVKILYRITEGEKSFVRKIGIEGNAKTKDNVIRRELAFSPGEEFNTLRIEKSKKRLENMGYFSQVDFRNNATGTPGYKDIDITVAEKSTGSINVGAGFSSIDSLVGFFSLTQTNFDLTNWPNFTGAGQRFNLDVRYGTKRRDASLSIVEPWFLGKRLSLGGDLFFRDLYYLSDVYDQQNYGAAVNLRKPLGEHAYTEFVYTAQNVKIYNVDNNASEEIKSEEGTYLQSMIALNIAHDTRDSVFITHSGHKLQAGLSYSGGFLGGDVDDFGLSLEAAQYVSLPYDMIFSIEGAVRTVESTGNGKTPIFDRLFLGGANNLRGFDYRKVGPKDINGEPLGGQTSAYASFELSFPIIEKVRGAVFYDVGMVSGDSYDWGGDVNSDFGIGLRLFFLPTGPIRLDFGIPMQADKYNDSGGKFNFNLGYKF